MTQRKKKILLFTDWFVPAYKAGGPIQSCKNFALLFKDAYDIYVLTGDTDFGDEKPLAEIKSNEWINILNGINVSYLSREKQNYKWLSQEIKSINPDFIYLNSMFSKGFTLLPLMAIYRGGTSAKTILAPRGMLHDGAIKYKRPKKEIALFIIRLLGINKKLYFQATDEQEKIDIQKRLKVKEERISLIQNLPQSKIPPLSKIQKDNKELKLVFVSRVAPKKNLKFFIEQLSKTSLPQKIQLKVYGPLEENYWEECSVLFESLPENIEIDYMGGLIPREVPQVLTENHFFILPTFGENFGHAIFESFAAGRPVIISDQTPWRGLEEKKVGWDIALENELGFLKAIEHAAHMEQEEYDICCENAKDYADSFWLESNLENRYKRLFS